MTELGITTDSISKIVERYNQLRDDNPLLDAREALEKAYTTSDFSTDFTTYIPYIFSDFVEEINGSPPDFEEFVGDFVEDAYDPAPARKAKRERGMRQQVGVAKRTPVGQALTKQHGVGIFEVEAPLGGIQVTSEAQETAEIAQLQQEIEAASKVAKSPQPHGWDDIGMTPVESSYVKGAGVYKNHLLIQFHHSPEIFGYALTSEKAQQFWQDLMSSGSKGEWVWDKLLKRPSEAGMAKGQFFSYQDKNTNKWNYYTTPGAQFHHRHGRPATFEEGFVEKRVGFSQGLDENSYETLANEWKDRKMGGYEEGLPSGLTQKWAGLGTSKEPWAQPTIDFVSIEREGEVYKMDFVREDIDLYNYLTENGKHKIKELYHEGKYRGYQVIDKLGNVLHEKVFSEAELKSSKSKGRGWWGDKEGHSEAAKKGRKDMEEDLIDSNLENQFVEGKDNALDPELFKMINFYVPLSKIKGNRDNKWEHEEIYEVDSQKYYKEFPPVTVYPLENGDFEFRDGFHRVNFCKREKLPVPCMVWKPQSNVHTHKSGVYTKRTYLVKDSECEMDQSKDRTVKCFKGKKNALEYQREKAYDKIEKMKQEGKLLLSRKEVIKTSGTGKGRGWWGDPERHSTAAKKGKQLLKGDEPKMVKRDFELNDKLVLTLDAKSEKDGRWITVHGGDDDPETAGTHVFIKKGQTAKEAIDEKFKGKSEGKKESKETEKKEPKVEKSEPKTEKKEVSTETYERLIREKQKTEDKHRCVVAKKRIEVMVKKLKNIEKLKELQNLTDKQKNTIDQESKVKKALKSAERAYRKYSELEEGEKKEVSKQTKKMPKPDPRKDDPDLPPEGHTIDEKSGKLKKTEAQKEKEAKEKATAEKKQLSKSEKQAKLKELGDELKKNKSKMNTQAAGTIIELLIKLLQTGSAQDTYAEFKRIRSKNSVMISKDVRLRKSIDKVEKQLKTFDFELNDHYILKNITRDAIDLSRFKMDFTEDYTKMYGPITHGRKGGHFDYRDKDDPDKIIRVYKDYENLKDIYSKADYHPVIGTQGKGSHRAAVIGFTHKFEPRDDTEEIFAETILFNDLIEMSDIDLMAKRQVSIGFDDDIVGDIQYIKSIDHLAMSLDNDEMGRCKLGGRDCYQQITKTDFVECPYGIDEVLTGMKEVITITNRGVKK